MVFYKSCLLASALALPVLANAQYGQLTPDPFDEVDLKVEGQPEAAAVGITPPEEVYEEYGDFPTYISLSDSLNDFSRFADGGSDSNWYIGFNNAWIVKLPPAPPGEYTRAFIGAKIGRAKTKPKKKRPWERRVIPGKIYMAVSQKPAFSAEQSFFLAETKDIPTEPDPKINLEGTGRSEWFWAEVPLNLVNFQFPNYLIIWSPSRNFRSATVSPILAAAEKRPGEKSQEGNTAWNNHELLGVPPRKESGTLQTPITLKPALAIKLVPAAGGGLAVSDFSMRPRQDRMIFKFSAEGKNVELAWIEMSQDELEWRRVSRIKRTPPYFFEIPRSLVPQRGAYFRGKARDILVVEGNSKHIFVPGESAP
jgi:hypothetical protein